MKNLVKTAWKHALFVLLVFAFVGLGAAATAPTAPASKPNKEGKVAHAEKAKKQKRKKTQAEAKGNKTLTAQSETDNENLEKPRETAEEGNEKAE